MFNRFKLGRSLDEVSTYGCDLLFSELALAVCVQEGIDQRFNHLDTTSFSLSGEYAPESDEPVIIITHGHPKDHRPDLKQAVLELMVSQDGGVPLLSKSWDGNASDTVVFQERAQTLMTTFKNSPSPRYVVGEYCGNSTIKTMPRNLKHCLFITRIPHTIKVVSQVITQALAIDTWHDVDEQRRYQCLEFCHFGIEQRWLVVHSEAAAGAPSPASVKPSRENMKRLKHNCFTCKHVALTPRRPRTQRWPRWPKRGTIDQVDSSELIEHKRYANKGRPRSRHPVSGHRVADTSPVSGQMPNALDTPSNWERAMC